MALTNTCIVCGGGYNEGDDCKCNPTKYDGMMSNDDPLDVREITAGKSFSDKLADGFMMLDLTETEIGE